MDAPREDTLFGLGATVPLPVEFFARGAEIVARELLGCVVVSRAGGALTAGRIVETEAYLGAEDPGSHAATKGVTPRNQVMFGAPGVAYVYFTYGNHYMLNAVCEPDGVAGAVLVRALEPVAGEDIMTRRRRGRAFRELCSGPGRLTQALAIDLDDNGTRFGAGRITFLPGAHIDEAEVGVSGRVGLSNGHDLPLRFFLTNSEHISKGRTGPPRHQDARR